MICLQPRTSKRYKGRGSISNLRPDSDKDASERVIEIMTLMERRATIMLDHFVKPAKFREGYDQDEVDDFLDEIVVELRRLNAENDELRRRLSALGEDVSSSKEQQTHNPRK